MEAQIHLPALDIRNNVDLFWWTFYFKIWKHDNERMRQTENVLSAISRNVIHNIILVFFFFKYAAVTSTCFNPNRHFFIETGTT
jgi:hypothetical protein